MRRDRRPSGSGTDRAAYHRAVNSNANQPKKVRQPISYTVGVPIAVVLFITLLIGAVIAVRSTAPTGSERRAHEQRVVEVLRDRLPLVFPADNSEPTGVTAYAEQALGVTTLRVHGVLRRDLQGEVLDAIRAARPDLGADSIVVEFYYPEARPEGLDPDSPASRIPTSDESPEPFRIERL